jgi:CRISPR system Cascade subunit CasD
MECLMLRFDAPLISFGGVVVDQHHPVDRFPGLSMLTGLLANALGCHHREMARLNALQARLTCAARWDRLPEHVVDYQTVDLGQDHLADTGWTTRGVREDRGTGAATSGTHIRLRHYWANGVMTVALAVHGHGEPDLDALEDALRAPARPLFLGRKNCLPSIPVLLGRRTTDTLRQALSREPLAEGMTPETRDKLQATWPEGEGDGDSRDVYDVRDWLSQMHLGSRRMVQGLIEIGP